MKTTSTHLSKLISSLNKREKGYFKRYVQRHAPGKVTNSELLFDKILADNLKTSHKEEKDDIKNIAVAKYHLYQQVTDCLHLFYSFSDEEEQVKSAIHKTRILIEKDLKAQASKLIRKTKKQCYQHEFYSHLISLIELERALNSRNFQSSEQLSTLFEETETCLAHIRNKNELWHLNQQIYQLQLKYPKVKDKTTTQQQLQEISMHPLLANSDLATTVQSKVYFFKSKAILAFMTGASSDARNYNKLLLSLMDEHPFYKKRHPEAYISALNNYLIDCFVLTRYSELELGLTKLRKLGSEKDFKRIKNIEARIFRQSFLLELNMFLIQKKTNLAQSRLPKLKQGLDRFKDKIEPHHQTTFHFMAAYISFCNKQLDLALDWVHPILKESKHHTVHEIVNFSHLLHVLIHFDLNNFTLVESLIMSTKRQIKKSRSLYPSEKTIFQYLLKLINTPKGDERLVWERFAKEIAVVKANGDLLFNYLDVEGWIMGTPPHF